MEIKKAAITHANFFCKAKDVTHNCTFFLEFASEVGEFSRTCP